MDKKIYLGRKFMDKDIRPNEREAMAIAFAHGLKNPVFAVVDNFEGSHQLVVYENGTKFRRGEIFKDVAFGFEFIHGREIDLIDYSAFREEIKGVFESLKVSFGGKDVVVGSVKLVRIDQDQERGIEKQQEVEEYCEGIVSREVTGTTYLGG